MNDMRILQEVKICMHINTDIVFVLVSKNQHFHLQSQWWDSPILALDEGEPLQDSLHQLWESNWTEVGHILTAR